MSYHSKMIAFQFKKSLLVAFLFILLTGVLHAQGLQPSPDLLLLDSGYGAAALGMGGAFVSVATDLSAVYWNPAGTAQLNGMQFFIDYSVSSDSDEDFASEEQPNSFQSAQRYSLTGNQFNSFALSYTFRTKSYRFTPFGAWHRYNYSSPERELKEPAGMVNFLTPREFYQSEGTLSENRDGGDEEWAFGMAAMVSGNILFGGTISFLKGNPQLNMTGSFHDTFVDEAGTTRSDVTLNQTNSEDLSGSSFKLGMLFYPQGPVRLGGTLRFPYTRKSDLTFKQSGTVVTNGISAPLQQEARAKAEVDVPMEWSLGAAVMQKGSIVSFSVTYSDYSETVQTVRGSTNPLLIPDSELLYPVLRPGALQTSLLQYRVGTEYIPGKDGTGLIIRGGYVWDGQPYGNGDRRYFSGFSFGAGFAARSFRADLAYVREKGDVRLTSYSTGDSNLSVGRFIFGVSLLSQ